MSQSNAVSNDNGLMEENREDSSQQNQYVCSNCTNRSFNTYLLTFIFSFVIFRDIDNICREFCWGFLYYSY